MFPCMPVCLCLCLQISEAGGKSHKQGSGVDLGEKSRWALQEVGRAQRSGELGLIMLLLVFLKESIFQKCGQ